MRILTILTIMTVAFLFSKPAFSQISDKALPQLKIRELPPAMPLYRQDTLKVIIVGDIMMHTKQIETALKKDGEYNFTSYFKHIQDKISEADLAIGNMEFTLGGKPYTGYPSFSAPDGFEEYLAQTGFDIFLCANNHIFDKGGTGAQRTLEKYGALHQKYGTFFTGLRSTSETFDNNNPLFVVQKGIRLAFVNFTYDTNNGSNTSLPKANRLTDKVLLKSHLNKASSADIVITLPHWGIEYMHKHSISQRQEAELMIKEGADIIVGSHPHVVQDFEMIGKVPVIYSTGNAVSNMSAPSTQVELMVELKIIRHKNGDLTIDDPEFIWLWCSRPGGYCNDYCVLPIEEFVNRRDEWVGQWEYEKMILSWKKVMDATGIGRNQ